MNTIDTIKHLAIMLVFLFCLPLSGEAQKKVYWMVLEKTDGDKMKFCVIDDYPSIWCGLYPGGDVDIIMPSGRARLYLDEIKSIFTIDKTVDYGDVTCSGSVDVQDITIVVSYILNNLDIIGNDAYTYAYSAADMNDDDELDVFDVTAMVNVILSGNSNSASARSRAQQGEDLESVRLTTDHNGLLFDINNAERFTSFQFDVEVPQGSDLIGVEWNGDSHHLLQFAQTGEKRYTVVALSMSNALLPQINDGLLKLQLSGTASGEVSVDNVLFVTPQGKVTHFSGQSLGMTTDIHGVIHSSDDKVYDLSGRSLNKNRNQLSKGLYLINNKKVVIN